MNILSTIKNIRFPDRAWCKEHKSPIFYTGSSISVSLAQLIAGIVVIRWIIPEELGLWLSVKLALTYSFFILAGVINGLSRELPFSLGNDNENRVKYLAGTALLNTTAGCVFVLLGGVGIFLFYRNSGGNVTLAIWAVTLLIIFGFYRNYLIVTFRSKNSFRDLAVVQMWEAFLMVATIPLIYYFHYNGMLFRIIVVTGIILLLLHQVRPIRVSPTWDKDSFKLLMKTGMPIFGLDYIRSSASTFDRIALLYFTGVKEVGYYALAIIVYQTFSVIPISIGNYVYPRMSYSFGKDNDPRILWRMAWKAMILVVIIMAPLALAGWFLLPPVVQAFFPQYVEGTDAARIMLFTAVFASTVVGVNALWSMKAWKWMVVYQGSLSTLLVVGPFLGVVFGSSPLTGVAYGMFWARLVSFALGIGITYVATHKQTKLVP